MDDLARLGFDARRDVLGLAVSGGSDSRALLHLAHEAGLNARVATVDHGLRAGSAAEAAQVAHVARSLALAHDTLIWQGWDGRGNVQGMARRARRDLLAVWARQHGLTAVALAHTRDDLAETFMMRLARGAGVDGLAAMQGRFVHDGTVFMRPLLWASRAELRADLVQIGADWIDDPSNTSDRFDRARLRKSMPQLQELGLTAQVLAGVAQHLAEARDALDRAADNMARAVLTENAGIITLHPAWQDAPAELQRRLIQRVILWIAPADYAPRGAAITQLAARLRAGLPAQLAGCHFLPQRGESLAFRESGRAAAPCAAGEIWDDVWLWAGPLPAKNLQIRALGPAGLAQWPGWRALGLPRAALIGQPSLWDDAQLLATPLHSGAPLPSAFLRRGAANSLYSARLSD